MALIKQLFSRFKNGNTFFELDSVLLENLVHQQAEVCHTFLKGLSNLEKQLKVMQEVGTSYQLHKNKSRTEDFQVNIKIFLYLTHHHPIDYQM